MSIDNKNKINNLNCFSQISTRYCEERRGIRRSFHENIIKRKDFILHFFDSQPYYNEFMPTIKKNSRGNIYYKNMIKKGWERKSGFFQILMNEIEKSNKEYLEKYNEKTKKVKLYKITKLDLLKKQKEKLELILKKKLKKEKNDINEYDKYLIKNNSMKNVIGIKKQPSSESIMKSTIKNVTINDFNNSNNNLNKTISNDTFHTNNKNESMQNLKSNISLNGLKRKIPNIRINSRQKSNNIHLSNSDLKGYFNKYCEKSKYEKNQLLENVINKCNEEINLAQNMEENVGKNNNKSTDDINKKMKIVLKSGDQKVIEEKNLRNKKYQKLEKEKFNELKKNIDLKISNSYAYIIRKEIKDLIRDNENISAYQIYLRDMYKFNKRLAQKKILENKNLILVENLLEDAFRQKEFLKYKVDNYYIKNAKQDELDQFCIQNKDELYENNNNDNKLTRGNLLPKLKEIKDYCFGREKYSIMSNSENN